jgi:hypothetical protein
MFGLSKHIPKQANFTGDQPPPAGCLVPQRRGSSLKLQHQVPGLEALKGGPIGLDGGVGVTGQ